MSSARGNKDNTDSTLKIIMGVAKNLMVTGKLKNSYVYTCPQRQLLSDELKKQSVDPLHAGLVEATNQHLDQTNIPLEKGPRRDIKSQLAHRKQGHCPDELAHSSSHEHHIASSFLHSGGADGKAGYFLHLSKGIMEKAALHLSPVEEFNTLGTYRNRFQNRR